MSKYGNQVEYNGNTYISISSLCKDLHLPYSPVSHKYHQTKDINQAIEWGRHIKANPKAFIVWGHQYNSLSSIATAFGINKCCLENRLNENTSIEEIITSLLQKETITFEGNTYPNLSALSTAYGMDPSLVIARLSYGLSLYDALYQPIKKRNRPEFEITYHGKIYESKRQLSRDLGISISCIIEMMSNHNLDYETAVDIYRETKERSGIPKDTMISYLPICIINGKWFKTLVEVSAVFKLATSIISTYKHRHKLTGILETLQHMQKETKSVYLLDEIHRGYKELRKLGYKDSFIKTLTKTEIPYYPQLNSVDLYTNCIDVLKIYTQIKEEKIPKEQ